jgi:hypothetical protein
MINISSVNGVRRDYPQWNQRGKIKKVDEHNNVVEGQHACAGEVVRVSPRYQKNGMNYRIRPERPAAFFAAFLHEGGVLPTLLTAEECAQEWALELLDPLWEEFKHHFNKLESPFAASDTNTTPSHRTGFSFNILQVLIEDIGTVRATTSRPTFRPGVNGSAPNAAMIDSIRRRIEEARAKNSSTKQELAPPAKKKS